MATWASVLRWIKKERAIHTHTHVINPSWPSSSCGARRRRRTRKTRRRRRPSWPSCPSSSSCCPWAGTTRRCRPWCLACARSPPSSASSWPRLQCGLAPAGARLCSRTAGGSPRRARPRCAGPAGASRSGGRSGAAGGRRPSRPPDSPQQVVRVCLIIISVVSMRALGQTRTHTHTHTHTAHARTHMRECVTFRRRRKPRAWW